jgi:hypothetical protein
MKKIHFISFLFLFSCKTEDPNTRAYINTIDSLKLKISYLETSVSEYYIKDSIRIADSINSENSINGMWSLDFNYYNETPMNEDERNYINGLRDLVTSFTYNFLPDGKIQLLIQLIESKHKFNIIGGYYTYSEDSTKLEIERISDEIVFDNKISEYDILIHTNSKLILKSNNIHLYFKKNNSNLHEFLVN